MNLKKMESFFASRKLHKLPRTNHEKPSAPPDLAHVRGDATQGHLKKTILCI